MAPIMEPGLQKHVCIQVLTTVKQVPPNFPQNSPLHTYFATDFFPQHFIVNVFKHREKLKEFVVNTYVPTALSLPRAFFYTCSITYPSISPSLGPSINIFYYF